jgi:type II restriction enzyme
VFRLAFRIEGNPVRYARAMPRDALRQSHVGITLNDQSSKMEERLGVALGLMEEWVKSEFGLTPVLHKTKVLDEIVDELNERFGEDGKNLFQRAFEGTTKTSIKPDGGFWTVREWPNPPRYILVAEAKRQGTNNLRLEAGLKKQAAGNAIERLGKNMRGIDALFLGEQITPFVCFGEGCDFAPDCSIIDRVATLNGFFPLNVTFVNKIEIEHDTLKPVSLYFREESWTPEEMFTVIQPIVGRAIEYYRAKYNLP